MDKKGVEIDRKGDQKKCSPLDTVNWKKTQKRNTLNSFPKILVFCAIYRVFHWYTLNSLSMENID